MKRCNQDGWKWKKGALKIKGHIKCTNINAVGKNIKLGKGEGDGNFWEENKDLKKWGWGRVLSFRKLLLPWKNLCRGQRLRNISWIFKSRTCSSNSLNFWGGGWFRANILWLQVAGKGTDRPVRSLRRGRRRPSTAASASSSSTQRTPCSRIWKVSVQKVFNDPVISEF